MKPYEPRIRKPREPMKPPVIPGSEPSKNAFPDFVLSENVAKLIAILATFSRTGHNWARLDFCGIAV